MKRAITGNVRKGGKWYEKDREHAEVLLRQEAEAKDKKQHEKVKLAAFEKLQDKASNVQIGFGCHISGEEFSLRKELNMHLNDHQKRKTYFTCHSFLQKFTDYTAYLQHQGSHKKREFICCECRLVSESYKEPWAHAGTHKFPCTFCFQLLGSQHELQNHMKFLPQILDHKPSSFVISVNLQQSTLHSTMPIFNDKHRKFRCRYCRNSFSLQAELDTHCIKEHPPRQEDDPVDPAQPSTSTGVSSQSVQTSQASTKTDVNPLLTAEGGTVQPLGLKLRQCTMCGVYFGNW